MTNPRAALGCCAALLGALVLLAPSEASAQGPDAQRVYVAPMTLSGESRRFAPGDAEQLRAVFASRLRATGEVIVVPASTVESHFARIQQTQGVNCAAELSSCGQLLANELDIDLIVVPSVSDYGTVNLSVNVIDIRAWGHTTSFYAGGRGGSVWSALRDPIEELVEEIADYANADPELRWRRPPIERDAVWWGLYVLWIPWGAGTIEISEADLDPSTRATFSDDALYGFAYETSYTFSRLRSGVRVWWLPSTEYELDGPNRRALTDFDPGAETSIVGASGQSADELDFNAFLEVTASWAELTGNTHLTELNLYLDLEGGYTLGLPFEDRDVLDTPSGFNLGGGLGILAMDSPTEAMRLGVHVQYVELTQTIESASSLRPGRSELELTLIGWRAVVLFGGTIGD